MFSVLCLQQLVCIFPVKTMNNRRQFLKQFSLVSGAIGSGIWLSGCQNTSTTEDSESDTMDTSDAATAGLSISLAQWSLHKSFFGDSPEKARAYYRQSAAENQNTPNPAPLSPDDFPKIAAEQYNIYGIELVNTFYLGKVDDTNYWERFKEQCAQYNVQPLLIMCDGLGNLGDADPDNRQQAVENHYPWVDVAANLGCHSIRVNAAGEGTPSSVAAQAVDGLRALTEYGKSKDIHIIVENHGGYSSDGKWLAGVINEVNDPYCGTLPDFGNFCIEGSPTGDCERSYDRYLGVNELLPYAQGVSAKSYDFDENGNETTIDFQRMIDMVHKSEYTGYVGIEYEGSKLSEPEGIKATKALLEKCFMNLG
jgi:sugar phosphate isomerase/epimerase